MCETDSNVYKPNALTLMLVCQQMRNETQSLLDKGPQILKLDLAIMRGRELWSTWTSLPTAQRVVDIVEVRVRVAGPGPLSQNKFRGCSGGPPPWVWWFYNVLEHFIMEGIVSPEVCSDSGTKAEGIPMMAVRILDLDVVDPFTPIDMRRISLLTTERVFYGLVEWVHQLLGMSSNMHYYGELLYTSIEKIRFRLRGELKEEVDLGDLLRQWPLNYQDRAMGPWLERTAEIRQMLGLANPVGGPRRTESHPWRLHTVFHTAERACAGLWGTRTQSDKGRIQEQHDESTQLGT